MEVVRRPQLTLAEKGQIIGWFDSGVSVMDISRRVQRCRNAIIRIIAAYRRNGNFDRVPGSGRRRLFTELEHQNLVAYGNLKN